MLKISAFILFISFASACIHVNSTDMNNTNITQGYGECITFDDLNFTVYAPDYVQHEEINITPSTSVQTFNQNNVTVNVAAIPSDYCYINYSRIETMNYSENFFYFEPRTNTTIILTAPPNNSITIPANYCYRNYSIIKTLNYSEEFTYSDTFTNVTIAVVAPLYPRISCLQNISVNQDIVGGQNYSFDDNVTNIHIFIKALNNQTMCENSVKLNQTINLFAPNSYLDSIRNTTVNCNTTTTYCMSLLKTSGDIINISSDAIREDPISGYKYKCLPNLMPNVTKELTYNETFSANNVTCIAPVLQTIEVCSSSNTTFNVSAFKLTNCSVKTEICLESFNTQCTPEEKLNGTDGLAACFDRLTYENKNSFIELSNQLSEAKKQRDDCINADVAQQAANKAKEDFMNMLQYPIFFLGILFVVAAIIHASNKLGLNTKSEPKRNPPPIDQEEIKKGLKALQEDEEKREPYKGGTYGN